jgi:transketolase
MGMQQMMIIADGKDNLDTLLTKFDSFGNLLLPLNITDEGEKSRMFKNMSPGCIKRLKTRNVTMNNHKMGVSPYKFKQHKNLNNFFKMVSTNKDRQGKKFVSTIEAHHYPFYGVQWHPERNSDMDEFGKFFLRELKKNKNKINNKITKRLEKKIYSKKIDCMNYSGDLYKKCNFYWHKKTSKHNRRLCSNAQTQKAGRYSGV